MMHRISVALLLALLTVASAPSLARAGEPDATAPVYSLDLQGSEGGFRWAGRQSIEFSNPGATAIDRIWIRLWGNGPAGCDSQAVRVSGFAGATAGAVRQRCTALELILAAPVAPGARGSVSFDLDVRVPATKRARFGAGDPRGRVALLSNALPALAHLERGRWRLDPYFDDGEAWTYPASDWNVRLTAPPGIEVVAPGVLEPDGTRRLRRARDYSFAAGAMRVRRARIGAVDVTFAIARGDLSGALARVQRLTRRQLPRLQRAFGPYGWPDLQVVVTESAAMEQTGLIMTSDDRRVVAHELAHMWWYGSIGSDQARAPWLDEGFASYGESLAVGRDTIAPWCQNVRPGAEPITTRGVARFNPRRSNYWLVYDGGGCLLERLRDRMGARRFARALHSYAIDNRYGWSTAGTFRRAMDRASPVSLRRLWRKFDVRR